MFDPLAGKDSIAEKDQHQRLTRFFEGTEFVYSSTSKPLVRFHNVQVKPGEKTTKHLYLYTDGTWGHSRETDYLPKSIDACIERPVGAPIPGTLKYTGSPGGAQAYPIRDVKMDVLYFSSLDVPFFAFVSGEFWSKSLLDSRQRRDGKIDFVQVRSNVTLTPSGRQIITSSEQELYEWVKTLST